MAADDSLARAREGQRDGEAEPATGNKQKKAAQPGGPSSKRVTEATTHPSRYRLKSYCTIRRK
jgi:hypothetical protein